MMNKTLQPQDEYELEILLAELQIYGNDDIQFTDIINKHVKNISDELFLKKLIEIINTVTSRVNEILDLITALTTINSIENTVEADDQPLDVLYENIIKDVKKTISDKDELLNSRNSRLVQLESQLSCQVIYVEQILAGYNTKIINIVKQIIETYIKMKRKA